MDKAVFNGDVTVPDDTMFRQGTTFAKTWQVQNAGTCTWGPGYALVYAGGDLMNGPQSMPLPAAKPGDTINISVNLTAPPNGGSYLSDWMFQRPDGTRFGVNSSGVDYIWVKINVSYVVLGPSTTPNPAAASCSATSNADYINQVLVLVNHERTSRGLAPLVLQPKLSAAAQVHSLDMACNNYLDHTGTDGSKWYDRIKAQGYAYSFANENIFAAPPAYQGTPVDAVAWWMGDQIHRDNILSTKVTEIGIGYAYNAASSLGGYYTLDFARP